MVLEKITLLSLIQNLQEENGDYLAVSTTTNIAASNALISTTLRQFDEARNGYFDSWTVYLNTTYNPSIERKVGLPGTTTYATASGTLSIAGPGFQPESETQPFSLTRYPRTQYKNAILEAIKRIYPAIHKRLDVQTLVTGNQLPDGSFESWSSTSALTHYTNSGTGTLLKTSTNTYLRNGVYCAKFTAGAANDYFYITSKTYPGLLDLQGKTVSLYCWAYPEVADDAFIVIYTIQKDGTAQTLTSTTTCEAAYKTKLVLENQTLNDNLDEIQIRFKVTTNAAYTYFDDACLFSGTLEEYLLPDDFIDGHVSQVQVQTSGHLDPICYDLNPFITGNYEEVSNFNVVNSGGYKYIQIPTYPNKRRIRLIGTGALETLSADTDTLTIDSEKVPLLIALAKYIFWKRNAMPVSSQATDKVLYTSMDAYGEYLRLLGQLGMNRPYELIKR